jgi:Mg-chelatase subunit ChlI
MTISSTSQLIDRFGMLKARVVEIKDESDSIKADLIERVGEGKAEGETFRAAISRTLRSTTDWQAVALHLLKKSSLGDKAFDNLVAANTSHNPSWVIRCNARIGSGPKDPA